MQTDRNTLLQLKRVIEKTNDIDALIAYAALKIYKEDGMCWVALEQDETVVGGGQNYQEAIADFADSVNSHLMLEPVS